MLPPQLQGVARPRSMSTSALHSSTSTLVPRSGTAFAQTRSLWWKRPCDYASQIDPMYHRMCRFRTLKTRAKMLDKLRRRGKFDWDGLQRPFFTPKHIRCASHVGRPKWSPEEEQKLKALERERTWSSEEAQKLRALEEDQGDGFELSQREKEWKEHMEALRKCINQDPYEAVFGRRFEPFWTPLVPQWMKEEIGYRSKDASEANPTPSPNSRPQDAEKAKATYRPLDPEQSAPARYNYDPKKTSIDVNSDSPNGQQTSYSYGATTTWDSWTKKASRVEWDSASGEKRRYEYDPISNRMVQVKGPPESEAKKVEDALKDYPARSQSPLMSHGWQSGLGSKESGSAAVNIPVKTSKDQATRQAISVPTQNSNGLEKTSVYFPSLINTAVAADAPRPTSLANHERYPDSLTASEVRASVGQHKGGRISNDEERAYRHGKPDPRKMSQWEQAELAQLNAMQNATTKPVTTEPKPQQSTSITAKVHNASTRTPARLQPALERIQSRSASAAEDPDDSAAHESTGDFGGYNFNDIPKVPSLASRPADRSLHDPTPAQDDVLRKSGTSMVELLREKRSLENRVQSEVLGRKSAPRWIDVMNARKAAYDLRKAQEQSAIDARDAAKNEKLAKANALLQAEIDEQKSRMSAHEHRHPAVVESPSKQSRNAEAIADQSEHQRYQDKIRDLRKELDIAYKQSSSNAEGHVDTIRKLEKKLQTSLEGRSDVRDAEKKKYIKKIKTLREELDTAFRQSSINAEMQVDRIRELEKELEKARNNSTPTELLQAEGDMNVNVAKFAKDSSKWYKQQAHVYAKTLPEVEGQLKSWNKDRDAALSEHELRAGSAYETKTAQSKQETSEISKKEPHTIDQALAEYERRASQRKHDRALVDEVRDIYESRYGTIDVNHRQTSVDAALEAHEQEKKLTPSVDEALGEYEHKTPPQPSVERALEEYKTHQPSVDAALMEHERKRTSQEPSVDQALAEHEQKLKIDTKRAEAVPLESDEQPPQPSALSKGLDEYERKHGYTTDVKDDWKQAREAEIAQQEKQAHEAQAAMDKEVYGTRTTESDVQHPIKATPKHSIQWQEPPIYKVLAYDSGNDFLVTSTTSTNFTGNESPISIPEALSQLYQPARFIPEFAELQKQNFQVIYATRDLLVLRKAKTAEPAAEETTLQDHGLITPSAEPRVAESPSKINPVDKTGLPEPATGSFASPTGFVGDRWDSEASPETQAVNSALKEYEVKHFPRVTRQEHVFSGSRLTDNRTSASKRREAKEQRRKSRGWRRSAKWALISGCLVGVGAYGIGAAAERSRERDMERWQRILQEQRALGGLGADGRG